VFGKIGNLIVVRVAAEQRSGAVVGKRVGLDVISWTWAPETKNISIGTVANVMKLCAAVSYAFS